PHRPCIRASAGAVAPERRVVLELPAEDAQGPFAEGAVVQRADSAGAQRGDLGGQPVEARGRAQALEPPPRRTRPGSSPPAWRIFSWRRAASSSAKLNTASSLSSSSAYAASGKSSP